MHAFRSVFVLFVAVWFLQLAGGTLGIIVPLGLSELGADAKMIGFVAALYAAGMMIGAYIAPQVVARTGNIRTFSAAASLTVVGSLALSFILPVWAWAPIRIVQGIGFAAMFASAEAWLGQAAPENQRGSVLGGYNVAAKAAIMTGPFLIAGAAPLAPHTFVLTGLFLACALIPVCLTKQIEPTRHKTKGLPIRYIIDMAPSAMVGCFMAGVINTGTYAFLPIYAMSVMPDINPIKAAALAFAAANGGALLAQWPLGRLSDRYDRRATIAAQAGLATIAVGTLALFGTGLPNGVILILLGVWGVGSLTFYSISVAHGIDRMTEGRVTELMGVLIICWATGSVLGPILAGVVVSLIETETALFVFTTVGLLSLIIAMLVGLRRREPAKKRGRWHPAMPAPMGLMGAKFHRYRIPLKKKSKNAP